MRLFKKQKATSLVEIILYFTLLGAFLIAAMTFAIQIMNISSLSSNDHELQSNIDFIMQKITYSIEIAQSINETDSIFDSGQGVLALNMSDSAVSPTIIAFSEGNITFKEGSNSAIQLNSNAIQVDDLQFTKISYSKTPDQIVIDANFSAKNVDINSLQANYPVHVSISLRQ